MERQNSTLDDIAAVIGFTATLRLAAWYGNTNNLYVPEVVDDSQVLVRLMGRPAAERLAQAFPGEHLAVPRMTAYEEEERRCRIGKMLERGFSMREVSKFERISERRVQQVCRELEQAGIIKPVGPEKAAEQSLSGKATRKSTHGKPRGKSTNGKTPRKSALGKAAGEKSGAKTRSSRAAIQQASQYAAIHNLGRASGAEAEAEIGSLCNEQN